MAESLIRDIREAEASDALRDYLEMLTDSYGVDLDYHSEHALVMRPTDHMLTGHFPGLQEEGTTVTFSREQALAREDMDFLTWEHPIICEAMDMVLTTELGNAAIATLSLKGIPAGTLLLESVYCINCVAPRYLQVERFLPLSPIRLLVDSRGKDLAGIMPHARLNELCEKVKKPVALQIIKQVYAQVEEKMQYATGLAGARRVEILSEAKARMRGELGQELDRLEALREVNPSIRKVELEHLRHRIEECAVHIGHASLQLQALRLIVTT